MATTAVAREVVFALRREIAKIEGTLAERLEAPAAKGGAEGDGTDRWTLRRHGLPEELPPLALGSETLDAALGGGVPVAALTEFHGAQTRDSGVVAGFALGLVAREGHCPTVDRPLLWVATSDIIAEAGAPYGPGLATAYGIATEALVLACAPKLEDALWIAEEAAALTSLAAVVLEVRGSARKLDLTATRRLHRRARAGGRPVFLLRQAGQAEPTAAPVRLLVAAAPAAERPLLSGQLAGSIGPPAVAVTITRCRTGISATATLEWNDHEHAFRERPAGAFGTKDTGGVVSPTAHGTDPAPSLRPDVANRGPAGGIAA